MRKYISLILLITILFISNGYYLFFKYFQHSINKEIKQEIRKGINEEELSIFVIPINEVENIKWTKKDKEFIYKGLMYDVVKSKIVNNKKYYYCINDSKEEELISYYTRHRRRKNKLLIILKKVLNNKYLPEEHIVNTVIHKTDFNFYDYKKLYKSVYLETLSPPPQV